MVMVMDNQLVDGFGRHVEYLRMSVTDRCDLKCAYCMPSGGSGHAAPCDIMTFRDFLRLARIFAGLGVKKIRLTGGEPLLRKGIVTFIRQVKEIPGIGQIALTTNGMNLSSMAREIREAGVSKINISLDTLNREKFIAITGRDGLNKALEGIGAAMEAGFDSVKINMVVMKGINDDEIEEFARMPLTSPAQVRFIEFMPASRSVWSEDKFVSASAVKERIMKMGGITACGKSMWGGPAEIYKFHGALGELGFISAVSHHFCGDCNRLRLTSSGKLMTCLFGGEDADLHKLITSGADDGAIASAITNAVKNKNAVRALPEKDEDFAKRPAMTQVGG